jgi:hypothetical protein
MKFVIILIWLSFFAGIPGILYLTCKSNSAITACVNIAGEETPGEVKPAESELFHDFVSVYSHPLLTEETPYVSRSEEIYTAGYFRLHLEPPEW